jgi:predicted permease
MAVRLAIGAARGRLIRQLLSESLLLTVCGSVMGIAVAELLCRYMVAFLTTESDPIFISLTPDWRLFCFTAAVAILTCVLFGLAPALRATGTAPAGAMKSAGRGVTANRERFSLRRGLVIGQVALSLVLLAASLLFVRSLRNLTTLDAGLRQDGILIMNIDISRLHYTPERRAAEFRNLLTEVRATPGVDMAAATTIIPLSGNTWNESIEIPGLANKNRMIAWFSSVSEGYFQTVGMPLLGGRDFDAHDNAAGAEVAIVNQEFCRKFLAGASPLGRQVRIITGPGERPHLYQIVGLVKNAKHQSLREDFKAMTFVAQNQNLEPRPKIGILIRSHEAFGALSESLKGAVDKTDPEMSIEFAPFKSRIEESLLRDRLMATLSSFFGFLAAALATLGLYGVISYMVARRRSEIGIRMALGASRSGVLRLILKEAAVLLGIGLIVGTALALIGGKAMGTLLFGLKPSDPATILLAVSLLATIALIASFVPAIRAAQTEPMAALREE